MVSAFRNKDTGCGVLGPRSHSCKPNAIWHEGADALHVNLARLFACFPLSLLRCRHEFSGKPLPDRAIRFQVVRARMDISVGDEVCISYLSEELCREFHEYCGFVYSGTFSVSVASGRTDVQRISPEEISPENEAFPLHL